MSRKTSTLDGCIEIKPSTQTVWVGRTPVNITGLSKATGVSRSWVSYVLSGKRPPSLEMAKLLSSALGKGLEQFLTEINANSELSTPVEIAS